LYIAGSYAGNSIVLGSNNAYSPIIAQGSSLGCAVEFEMFPDLLRLAGTFTSAKEPAYPIISAGTAITLDAPGGSGRWITDVVLACSWQMTEQNVVFVQEIWHETETLSWSRSMLWLALRSGAASTHLTPSFDAFL
jgi:hypothetical protein